MLTVVVLILVGVALVHVLKDVVKAAVLVVLVAAVFYLARGVTFEALVDDGARALFGQDHSAGYCARPPRRI